MKKMSFGEQKGVTMSKPASRADNRLKIVVTTIYENVDQDWFDTYIEYLRTGPEDVQAIVDHFIDTGRAAIRSPDPSHPTVIGTTTYEVING